MRPIYKNKSRFFKKSLLFILYKGKSKDWECLVSKTKMSWL